MQTKENIKFLPFEETDDIFTRQEWLEMVKCGGFIDYDGFGELATETEKRGIYISPSRATTFDFPDWATHIVWYNR